MRLDEIMNRKYKDYAELFHYELKKIKPFSKMDDVKMEDMEKYIGIVERKYAVMINYVCPIFIPGENNLWVATINHTDTGVIREYIYGSTLYEVLCKVCIMYNSMIKKGLKLKEWSKCTERKKKMEEVISNGGKSLH